MNSTNDADERCFDVEFRREFKVSTYQWRASGLQTVQVLVVGESERIVARLRESMSPRFCQVCSWSVCFLTALIAALVPKLVYAQASPFATGAGAAQTNILTILTPIAVIAVMALGVAAWFNKISWGWAVAGVIGIVLVFGAPQLVTWVRGMFGV